jgi:hypothetical protein
MLGIVGNLAGGSAREWSSESDHSDMPVPSACKRAVRGARAACVSDGIREFGAGIAAKSDAASV